MSTSMRTHMCGQLKADDAGSVVVLCGWVAHRRDHGGVTFIDLRDREGVVQLVFHPDDAPDAHQAAQSLGAEDVVRVTGVIRRRPDGMVNPALETGDIEASVSALEILSESDTPPFPIEDRIEVGEDLRLKYRYLDLRRPEMTGVLRLRHTINRVMREHMESLGFVEVETPLLTRSTPEGARDFLVPSRIWPGTFYALPQSPQQLKQMLMVAGQDRYYQIVRCLRDERTSAERGLEFTQLDVEMSFIDEEDIISVMEPLYARIVHETRGVDVPTPFPRMDYDEMLDRYGSDKPDMRYPDDMLIADLSDVFARTEFRAFKEVVASGGVIRGISAPWGDDFSRGDMKQLEDAVKGLGAAGLVWLHWNGSEVRGPVAKFLSDQELEETKRRTKAVEGEVMFIVADRRTRVDTALDWLRRHNADRLGLTKSDVWAFCWMERPPLFEWSDDDDAWVSVHHLFTAPVDDAQLDPANAKARAYDLVLNGFEIGGGSIRIHRPEVQARVFDILGLSKAQAEEKFGHVITALGLGAPPHGGIAMGIDRLVMLMAGKNAIRDVTAFPKAQSGADPLTGAPAPVSDEQLRELGIRVVEQGKKES